MKLRLSFLVSEQLDADYYEGYRLVALSCSDGFLVHVFQKTFPQIL